MIVTVLYYLLMACIPVGFAILIAGVAIQFHVARTRKPAAVVEPAHVAATPTPERGVFDQDLYAA